MLKTVLDTDDAQAGPATASRLNATLLRITGKGNWIPATSTVYSGEYADLPNQPNSEDGHYDVTYIYSDYRRAAGAVRRVLGVGHAQLARAEVAIDC